MAAPRRFAMKWYWIALLMIPILALLPLGVTLLAQAFADAHGCTLGGLVTPCIVWGFDWAELLYAMTVVGWLVFSTAPAGAWLLVVWAIALAAHRLAWRRRIIKDSPL